MRTLSGSTFKGLINDDRLAESDSVVMDLPLAAAQFSLTVHGISNLRVRVVLSSDGASVPSLLSIFPVSGLPSPRGGWRISGCVTHFGLKEPQQANCRANYQPKARRAGAPRELVGSVNHQGTQGTKEIGKVRKPEARPSLTKKHKAARLEWARTYKKEDFSNVIWTDETSASLDGPDGWAKGWVVNGKEVPGRFKRQQGGGGVMIWAAIVDDEIIGPTRVPKGVKINSEEYMKILQEDFIPWYKSQATARKRKLKLMQDNAPSHSSSFTRSFLEKKGFRGSRLMKWPPNSPDLNPIEHLWAIIKQGLYRNGTQYHSTDELWEAIKREFKAVDSQTVKKLTESADTRVDRVIQCKGGYVGACKLK
ncbi:hypothetical protein FOL47_007305 [Perkinsus chesapeaki]|uniref:Tc1-like transposase DDE domain-containing protein n=1 Tax=Perkinsus chesapeaki TaxID=330153 RepID=A0A7J6LLQ0_PERCH|nr:hypothetical protein FOL47_007305 [Perkinsus chesapeaki]